MALSTLPFGERSMYVSEGWAREARMVVLRAVNAGGIGCGEGEGKLGDWWSSVGGGPGWERVAGCGAVG